MRTLIFFFNILVLTSFCCSADYPHLGRTDDESLTIAVQIIEGYLGKESPAFVKRLPSPHPQSRFTKRCGLQTDQSLSNIKHLLTTNKLTIEKDTTKGANAYVLGIQGRPDVCDKIQIDFPNDPKLNLLHQLLPLQFSTRLKAREHKPSPSEVVNAFYTIVDCSSVDYPKRTVLIRCPSDDHVGEKEWSKRIAIACQALGWSCITCHFKDASLVQESLTQALYTALGEVLSPDYAFCVFYRMKFIPIKCKNNFLYLTEMPQSFCELNGKPTPLGTIALKYNGLIDSNPSQIWLQDFTQQNGRSQILVLNGYPSTHRTSFRAPLFQGIFYCGVNWDSGRSSQESKNLFQALEELGLMHVYGPACRWQHLGSSYKGFIPVDGVSMLDRIHECGVGLCIHWSHHRDAAIPMSRFFEICAAGGLAICDNHPWIRKHFGDAALFFDHTKPWQDRVAEIKAHWDWIQSHPDEAKAMAKRAHTRFVEKYAIEVTLTQIENFETNHQK